MATASGISAQIGYKQEASFAVPSGVTRFIEFTDESLQLSIDRIESSALRAGRRFGHTWAPGVRSIAGDVNLELVPEGIGFLLRHAVGPATTTGAGPYTHVFTPGDIPGAALQFQVGRPDIDGTIQPFNYLGCRISTFEFMASVNEFVKFRIGIVGVDEDQSQALSTASYTAYEPYVFTDSSFTIAGSDVCVKNITISGDNSLQTDRHFICGSSHDPAQGKVPLESGMRTVSGSFTADFTQSMYDRFVNGTEAALQLVFASGTNSFTIDANVRFDGDTPTVSGPDILEHTVNFVVTSGTSDDDAFKITVVNSQSGATD